MAADMRRTPPPPHCVGDGIEPYRPAVRTKSEEPFGVFLGGIVLQCGRQRYLHISQALPEGNSNNRRWIGSFQLVAPEKPTDD